MLALGIAKQVTHAAAALVARCTRARAHQGSAGAAPQGGPQASTRSQEGEYLHDCRLERP